MKTSAEKRQRDIDVRCPEGDSDVDGGVCTSFPFLFTRTKGTRRMEHMQLLSEDVRDFYLKHGPFNQLVEVRSGVNIANKLGDNEEKGIFSLCPIPAGTHICPHVGEIYHKQPREGKFVMEVSKDVFVDAAHDPRDIGYLYLLDAGISSQYPSPPNYGRYINTIYPEDEATGEYAYNCLVMGDDSGLSVVWVVAKVDIPAGVEWFVDYGPAYHAMEQGRKRKRRRK